MAPVSKEHPHWLSQGHFGGNQAIMKTKTALFIALLLGLFSYTLPLYAGESEYYLEEKTIIDIPILGEITTRTTSYLSGCKLKETTRIKVHNALVKMVSESDGKTTETVLSNLCDEVQWTYREESKRFEPISFDSIRAQRARKAEHDETHIDMESDHNDIDELPRMVREILGYEKNINGHKARKVVTTLYPEDSETQIVVEEYYTDRSSALNKITRARKDLNEKLGRDESDIIGVPSLVNLVYDSMQSDTDWARPEGVIVRFVIRLLDKDSDEVFTMKYDVTHAETQAYMADHFALKNVD